MECYKVLSDSYRSPIGSSGLRIGVLWDPMGFVSESYGIPWDAYRSPTGSRGIGGGGGSGVRQSPPITG
eukprot:1993840-Pyramimonas_sp.AAC.1